MHGKYAIDLFCESNDKEDRITHKQKLANKCIACKCPYGQHRHVDVLVWWSNQEQTRLHYQAALAGFGRRFGMIWGASGRRLGALGGVYGGLQGTRACLKDDVDTKSVHFIFRESALSQLASFGRLLGMIWDASGRRLGALGEVCGGLRCTRACIKDRL